MASRPSRQSATVSPRHRPKVLRNPPITLTRHRAALFSTSDRVVVTTAVMFPRELSLK